VIIKLDAGALKGAANFALGILNQPVNTRRQLVGPDGFGKTTFLHALREPISSRGLLPVFVSPPIGDADTGCSALLQISEQLHHAHMMNGEFGAMKAPDVSWNEKLRVTKEVVNRNADRITLLLDEPDKWPASQDAELQQDSFSAGHADQIARFVKYEAPCRRIETTVWSPPDESSEKFIFNSLDLPLEKIDWGPLASVASELKKRLGANLSQASYLEMKLLVGLASVTSVADVVSLQSSYPTCWSIAKALIKAIKGNDKWRALWEVLSFSGLVRGLTTSGLLVVLGMNALSQTEKDILKFALLSHDGEGAALHPLVKDTINNTVRLSPPEKLIRHGQLAKFYSQLARPEADHLGTETDIRIEEFHHAGSSGDENVANRVYFVDQLHILGRTLSRDRKDYASAANVFRKVIEFDPKDDYGHHYLAYNLDCMAVDLPTVQKQYQEAIRLNPAHPWWHSRWINLLITTGRVREARREWSQSATSLQTGGGNAQWPIYEHLHKWVARLLLHRAQLDFAESVLDELPGELRSTDAGFRALDQLLTSMKIARDARAVFPISVPPEEYWHRPHLYFYETTAGRQLQKWNPARIDAIDKKTVSLIVGMHNEQSGQVVYGNVELPVTRFNDASLDGRADQLSAGRFIEMAFYGNDGLMKIRVHRDKVYSNPDLPYFDPPNPRRYLQKETASP
jgi:tetratricopeptide (TPR) repeat protein